MIAHEVGHHIQNLIGTAGKVHAMQQRGSQRRGQCGCRCKLELQADCYAGVWAAQQPDRLEPGDIEEGMTAANAIGDDTLQKQAQGPSCPTASPTAPRRSGWLAAARPGQRRSGAVRYVRGGAGLSFAAATIGLRRMRRFSLGSTWRASAL